MGEKWDKLERETSRSYAAFCIYRDLGTRERSLAKAHDEVYGSGANNQRWLEEWSRQNDWVSRAAAYDAHLDEIKRSARESALADAYGDLLDMLPVAVEQLRHLVEEGDFAAIRDLLDRVGLDRGVRVRHTNERSMKERWDDFLGVHEDSGSGEDDGPA